jgi:hypothetical protein
MGGPTDADRWPRLTLTGAASEMAGIWHRRTQRYTHLLFATWLGVVLYSPLGDNAGVELVTQTVVFPALVLSGLLLWKGAAIRRRIG